MHKRLFFTMTFLAAALVACVLVDRSAPAEIFRFDTTPVPSPQAEQGHVSTALPPTAIIPASPAAILPGATPLPSNTPTAAPTLEPTLTPTVTPPAQPSPAPAWSSKVDGLASTFLENAHLAGLVIGIHDPAGGDYSQGYGFSSVDASMPIELNTVFEIASLTKQFTSAAILQLVENRRIDLDAPISTYLSGLPDAVQDVTIRQLLSHTAGITDPDLSPDFNSSQILSKEDLITEYVDKITSYTSPGQAFQYSNAGYWLLGLVIESVSGEDYGHYLQEHIFGPLAMRQTSYCREAVPLGQPAGLAQGYSYTGGDLVAVNANMSLAYSAGGLCSTVGDLLTWIQSLTHGKVISPALYQQMITPVSLPNGYNTHYGLGLFVEGDSTETNIAHAGNVGSFQSYIIHYLNRDLDVVVLTNTGSSGLDLKAFAQSLIDRAVEPNRDP